MRTPLSSPPPPDFPQRGRRGVGRAVGICLYGLAVVATFPPTQIQSQTSGNSAAAQRALDARLPTVAVEGGAKRTPDAAEVGAAAGKAMIDFLDLTLPLDLTPADVIGEAVRTRAGDLAAVVTILSAVTEAILTVEPDSGARAVLDEATTTACLAVRPEDVAEVVRSQIALLATSPAAQALLPGGPRPPDELLPVEAYAERFVAGGIKALRKAPTARLILHIEDVAAKAMTVAPPYLYEEIAAASARSSSSGTVILAPLTGGASNLLRTLLAGVPEERDDVGAVVAGVLRGRGETVLAAVRVELANTRPAFTRFTDAVLEGYRRCATDHGEYHLTYLREEGAPFDRAGLIFGAAARWPSEVLKFTRLALETPGSNTSVEITRAAGRAVPLMAAEAAAYCVGARGTEVGEIARGFVEGAHARMVGGLVGRQLSAMGTVSGIDVRLVVAGAVEGARATGKEEVLASLAFEAARASRFPWDVAEQGLALVPPAKKALFALSALAANTGPAADFVQRGGAALAEDAVQRAAFETGAAAVVQAQDDVRNFLAATLDGLAAARTDEARLAVLQGVALVNPKGAPVVAAAGIAKTDEKLWSAVTETVIQASPGKAAAIRLAAEAARGLRRDGAAGLSQHVLRALFLHPRRAADIAAAAVIAAPEHAPQIAEAAATRTGIAAARMVPALLAFAQAQRGDTPAGAQSAHAAGITAAVVRGLRAASLRDAESGAITGAVEAALLWAGTVESAAETRRTGAAQAAALLATPRVTLAPGGLIESVIQAAVTTSPTHGLAIARVAAETLARFSRGQFTDAEGRLAAVVRAAGARNFSGQPAAEIEVHNAIAFGITGHLAAEAGASALELVNYARSDGLGRPVTAFRDE